jgi:hypothetical protein
MKIRNSFFLGLATASILAVTSFAQESPSLGDLARQQRQQKEQAKSGDSKDPKASKIITNEQIPEHPEATPQTRSDNGRSMPFPSNGMKQPPEYFKSQIQAQKSQIASLQRQMDQTNESIKFAPANCVGRCVQWNERQRQKQQQAERMQEQLQEEKKHLEEMQESARKQGYGSSVYDP